jgi:deazaflavin-dependent oxidoreductase (nitroreductase family)
MENNQDADRNIPNPPRGLRAIPWRLPILFYRLRLGWIFGHRALLLTHTGRISGQPRQAMLEVIRYEKESNVHFVASGFGVKSDWYRNIRKTPDVTIRTTGKKFAARARISPPEEADQVFLDYTTRHPNAVKNLARLVGYKIGNSKEEILDFLNLIPVIAFHPIE